MVQDIILRASWKAIWEAPDHPPPPQQPQTLGSCCSLPCPPPCLLAPDKSKNAAKSVPVPSHDRRGSEEKITTGIMLFNARSPKQLQEAVAGSGYPAGHLSTCPRGPQGILCPLLSYMGIASLGLRRVLCSDPQGLLSGSRMQTS